VYRIYEIISAPPNGGDHSWHVKSRRQPETKYVVTKR